MSLRLTSERLVLRLAEVSDAPRIVEFYRENRAHLAPFEPRRDPEFYEVATWEAQIMLARADFEADRSLRMWLFTHEDAVHPVGNVALSNVIRGVKQSCSLGYALAAHAQGKGYMREILPVVIRFAFEVMNLHRIEANYMPHNARSGKLLDDLGFAREGLAHDYLRIAGEWRDHVLTSLTNPGWSPR